MNLEQEVNPIVEQANKFEIRTNEDNIKAVAVLKGIKDLRKKIENTFNPIVDKAHKAWKEAIAQRDIYLKPLSDVEIKIRNSQKVFIIEQERIRKEQEDRLRKEAEEKAEKERQELKEAGLDGMAEEVKTPEVIVNSTVQAEGQVTREIWKVKSIDMKLLPEEYKLPDEKKINAIVRTMKDKTNIPGVVVEKDISVYARR